MTATEEYAKARDERSKEYQKDKSSEYLQREDGTVKAKILWDARYGIIMFLDDANKMIFVAKELDTRKGIVCQ